MINLAIQLENGSNAFQQINDYGDTVGYTDENGSPIEAPIRYTVTGNLDGVEWSPRPIPVYVPQAVTPYQARVALLGANLLAAVENAVANHPDPRVKLVWDYALTWERASPFIEQLGGALGLTDEQIDALFIEAGKV